MQRRDVRDLVRFDDHEVRTEVLFETERLFSRVICLQGGQGLGPLGDPDSDAICLVLSGSVAAQVGHSRHRMGQWEAATVPAGVDLTLRNASEEPSVVLLVAAPPPGASDRG